MAIIHEIIDPITLFAGSGGGAWDTHRDGLHRLDTRDRRPQLRGSVVRQGPGGRDARGATWERPNPSTAQIRFT